MTDYDEMEEAPAPNPLKENEVIDIFFDQSKDCSEIPMIRDCTFLRAQFNEQTNASGGCTKCRKRGLIHRYTQMIRDRL